MAASARSMSIYAKDPERLNQPGPSCEFAQRHFRTRAVMRDHFRRRERAQTPAISKAASVREAIKESCRELIAGTGGIDHTRDRRCIDDVDFRTARCDTAFFGPRQRGNERKGSQRLQRFVERIDREERLGLILIGEK